MTQKKSKSSKLAGSIKKTARALLSGKKDLAKLAATLPITAVMVEEVRAAQAKNRPVSGADDLIQSSVAEQVDHLDLNQDSAVQDKEFDLSQTESGDSVQDAAAEARNSLRAVLEDEIASAQAAASASASSIDPSAPSAGNQAIRSVLNDEVNYEVAKALQASPEAAQALAKLPDVGLPQVMANGLSGMPLNIGAGAVAMAALGGGAGGGVVAAVTGGGSGNPAIQLAFSGAAIDGYVQGATVNYQVKVDGVWTTVATTVTDAQGEYKFVGLKEEWSAGRVVIEAGGYDANTGQQVGAFISNAKASADADAPIQAATPLTMILAISGLGEDEFKAQLGITEVADLSTFDPVEAMKTGNAALGEKVFALQQAVYTLLQAASNVAGGGVSTGTSLNDAVAAVGKVIAANYAAELGVISLENLTDGAIDQIAVGDYADKVAHAINLTNEKIAFYYTGLAEAFREDPPSVESQSIIAGAKAAASVSQSSLLSALAFGTVDALNAFENSFANELALQVSAFKEVAALAASEQDLGSTIANPVFLVQQALKYTGGMPTSTQVKDLAGEFTQISLAKLIDLNVTNVTLLGTNDRVELLMQGNGSTNTDAELATKLQDGLFASKYTVTLRVNDGDIVQLLKQLQTVDLQAVGIDMLKPVAGTLKISKADALSLIDEGLSFATGSFQLKPGDTLSFADVQKLVIDGGLKLAENTIVDLSGDDVQLDTDMALELIAAGAKFENADNLSLLLEARHLNGNAQAVVDKLLSLVGVGDASTGLSFVFDTSSRSPASGVTFTSGKLALSGLTLTEAQASALVHADISQSVKFSNTAISFSNTAYAGNVDAFVAELKDLFKAGIKDFTVIGNVSKDIATMLLNIDSSVVLHATVTEPLTASIAMGFAARGITPTNVNFDIDYVKNYILVDGNKLTSTITVNVPFSDDTITPTDFVNLIAAGVRFQSGIGSVLIKDTDTAFTMGSDAVANQLKLVNAGLKLASGSAPITDASLTLANAQKLQAAHVNAADQVFGDITLQLSSADMAAANLKANLAALSYHDLTVRPISGSLTAAQVDALQTVKPGSPVHFEFASLQLDATSVAVAAQKAANYYSGLGITTAVVSATGMTYAQASALSAAGIAKVNAGLVVTLDASAATGHFVNLDSLAAMGFTKLSVPATSAITKAQFDEIIAEYPKFTFEPGSKIDLSDVANPGLVGTTLAKAAIYSAAGLTLTNMDTLAAKDISLSQAVSLAAKGAKFTSEVKGESLVIYKEANTATKTYLSDLSLNQVKSLFSAVAGGTDVVFKDFTSLRVSSTELGNLDAAMVAKLAKAGLPGISLIDSPSLVQVLKLSGSSLQFTSPVTLADKSVANVEDALTAIAKGAVFSGASLVLPASGGLSALIGNGNDLDGKSIGILKAKGVTTLDLSGGSITEGDATKLMNWGGIKFLNAQLQTDTGSIDVELVAKFAAMGILVPPTTAISSTNNTVTFEQAYSVVANGGEIKLNASSSAGDHVTVTAAGKASLTSIEAALVLNKVQNAAFTGVNSIQLAAKNADFAAVVAMADKLQDAGITSIKLGTGALSVNIGQLQTLTAEGMSFVSGSDVRLQLTSGDLSSQFTAIGTLGNNTAGVSFIKAAGASLTLSSTDFAKVTNGMKFVAADMVTVQVSSLNSSDLARYNTAGVDFVGAVGGKITISATAAQDVVTANTVKLMPTDVVTVSLTSSELDALTPQSVAAFKAVGVDNFAVETVSGGTPSVPLSAVKAILSNQLSFTSNVTVNVPVTDAADLTYVIDNSGSLAGAGVKQVHVTGGEASLTMKQLSSLLAAGPGGIKFVDNIKVAVSTAADLAYFASSAKDIQALQNVKELSIDPSIINIPLATAQLLAKSYHLTPPATVLLDFKSATQLSQDDFILLKKAGFVTFNFGGVSIDPSAQLDSLVAKLAGAGYVQGESPVEVAGIMVNTTFADNKADNTLKGFGFKDNTGFINKASLNLVDKSVGNAAEGNLVFEDGVFKVFEKGVWTEARTIISPTGSAVKIVASTDNAITAAEFKTLSSLTGGKVSLAGINLQLKDAAEALALTSKVVTAYKAVGITSIDASSISGWDVKTVSAVQAAGLKFANVNATIADGSITLSDYQAMKGLGFKINDTTLLRDKVVVNGVTTETIPSLTAAVAQQLLTAKDISLTGVVIKDGSLSASTALSLSKAGLNVSNVLVSGNVSVDDALALLKAGSPLDAPAFAVKGFFSGNTLTATATKTVTIDQALQLTKVLGLGNVRIDVQADKDATPAALSKLATLLGQDPTAKFATGSFLTCDSLTLSQAQQVFNLGVAGDGLKGAQLKLTLDSSNSNFSEILSVAKALKVTVIDCADKPLTLSTTQYADYIASEIKLDKVSGSIQLTVASPEDITYVVNNAVALNGKVALVTTGTSLTLTNEQFTTYQAADENGVKFADKVSISVSLTQDQLDASNLADTLAKLKAANVAGVVCLADKGLSNAAVAELLKAGVTVLGSPTLKVQPDPEKVGELFSAGFNVKVTPDLTNVSVAKALTLAAIDGVKTVSLVAGASELTVSQSDWLNPSARALIDKVLLSTGSKPAMNITGVEAGKVEALLAEQGVIIKQLALQAGQSIITSTSQWDGRWTELTTGANPKVIGLAEANITIAGVSTQAEVLRLASQPLVDKVYLSSSSGFKLDATNLKAADVPSLAKVYYAGGSVSLINSLAITDINDVSEDESIPFTSLFTNDLSVGSSTLSKSVASIKYGADSVTVSAAGTTVTTPYGDLIIKADGNYSFTTGGAANALAGTAHQDLVFAYTVQNGTTVETNSLTIRINGQNDAPELTKSAAVLAAGEEDVAYVITREQLLQGFTDADGQALSLVNVTASGSVAGVTITPNSDGSIFTVTAPVNYNGSVNLSYGVSDGVVTTAATNSFTLTAQNDAPQLTGVVRSAAVTEDQTASAPSLELLTGVATDVDSTTLSIQGPSVTAYMVDSSGNHISTVATFPSGLPLSSTGGAALWLDGTQLKINPSAEAFQFLNDGQKLEVSVSYKIADTNGGESSTATASFTVAGKSEGTSFSAKVIDGYVQGARVFYDTDGDGKYDVGEAFAITDADGNYKLFVDNEKLVSGGKGNLIAELDWKEGEVQHFATDKFTGKLLSGDLIAPEGFSYITPLTTLVALTVEKGQDPVLLAKSIADGLGLTASLQNYDPFASMTSTDPTVAAQAELVFKAQQMVFTVMQAATTALVEGSSGVTNPLLTMAQAVTNAITSGTPAPDLSDTLNAVSTKAINNLFKGDEVAVAKAGAIIQSINTVNAQIDDNYSGLSAALISKDPVAIAKAEAAAGVSQDLLIDAVKSVASAKTVSAISDATLSQADVSQAVTDAVVSDPDLANAKSIHKQDSGNLLQASLKSLAGKTAIVMDGVAANPVTKDFDVSINYAAAGDTAGAPTAAMPGVTAKDVDHKAISADELNVTLNVTGQSQVNELASVFASPSANLGALGIDNVNLSFADGDVENLLNASSALNSSINALAQEGVSVSGTIDLASKDALHLNDTQSTNLVLDGLHFADDDTIVLDVNASGTNLNTSLKQLQKLGVDAVSVAGGVDGINIDLGSDFNFSSMGGLPKFGDTNSNGTLTTDEEADLHVTLNATSSQVDGVADNASTFVSAGIDQVAFDLTSEGQLQSLLRNDDALNQLVDSRLDAVVDFGSADVNLQSLSIDGRGDVTLEVEAAQGTHLSTSLKDLQKLGVDAVSVAGGVDGINVDLGAGFTFDVATGSVTLFGDTNADGILSAQEDAALHVTLNATSNDLANLGADAVDFALAGVDEIFFDVGNEAGLTSLLGNDTALAALDKASLDVTVDVGGVHVDVDALHLDGSKITLDAEGASQGTHLSTSLKDLQKLGVDAVSVAGGVTELNLDLGSGSDAFSFDGNSMVRFEGDEDLRVTLSTTDAGQIDDLANAAGNLHVAGIDAVNLDLSGQGGLNALLGTGNLTDDLRALDTQLDTIQAAHVEAIVGISQDQAKEILKDASTFSFDADDTIVMHADTAAQGTHLSTSLKELQKLGVDAVSVAAGVTGINVDLGAGFDADLAGGVALFGDTNADGILSAQEDSALHVTLNASSSDLHNLSGDAADFALAGIDEIFFNAGDEAGLKTLLGDQAKLNQLDAANLDVTVDFGGVHVDVDALHLGKDGNITLDAEGASQGTHLSTSLKDLQKLGVDAVSVAGGVGEISLDLGDGALTFGGASVVNIKGDADLRVTLNTTDVDQIADIAGVSGSLKTAGIDAVNLDLSSQGSLDTLLGQGDLASEISALNTQLDALDHTGLQAIVGISQDQAQELIAEAANFTFDADLTTVLHTNTAAQGTHLNTSLKELQKLGVDAVSVAAGVTGISIDLGASGTDAFSLAAGGVALFGDANADGMLTSQEDAALHVTLNATDSDLASLSGNGADFALAGIDEVNFKLDAQGLENLLGQSAELTDLSVTNLDVTVDFGGVHVGVDALSIDKDGQITLDAAGASQGTHLNTSLKDLQKLGVDAVSVAGGVTDLNLDLGSGTEGFQFAGGSDIRITGDQDLNVTLNVADAAQLHDVAQLNAAVVSNIGIDAVKLDLSGQGSLDTLLGAGTLSRNVDALEADLAELRTDGLQSILGIDQVQAGELLAHGLAFNADDTILLNASVNASQGTHLSTSLKDLQKLGVDAISVAGGASINVDLGTGFGSAEADGFSAAGGIALFGDTNADGTLTAQEADALHVTLNATDADLAALSAGDNASQFALAGIDEISFKLDADGLETLLSAASADQLAALNAANLDVTVDFGSAHVNVNTLSLDADGDVVMQAQGTHLSTSLKDLQKLGVDAVSVAAGVSEINLDLGSGSGLQIQAGSLPTFASQDIDVTLNVANAAQLDELANLHGVGSAFSTAGIDAVKLDLSGEGSLDALLGRGQLGADFAALEADLAALRVGTTTLDTIVGIDQAQAQQLLQGGLDFNAADTVFLNASEGAQGTHLSTSLKDLQKLGVDAVSVAAGTTAINLDLGASATDAFSLTGGSVLFGDANEDGKLSLNEDNGLHVTLNALSGDLSSLSNSAESLNAAGIDEISFSLSSEGELESLLGSGNLSALNNIALKGIDATVDFGSSHINVQDLSYNSTTDKITYDLSDASQGTHLSTSLKDLQKLGVDAITVGAAVSDISLDLGSASDSAQFQAASLPVFGGGTDLHVTLNVADATQLDTIASANASQLLGAGIDAVKWDLSGEGSLDTLLGRGLLGADLQALETDLAAVRDGTALDTVIGIDQGQAHELLNAGLNFAFAGQDTALLNASAGAQGTHLSTSLKDLQKLGIDAVTVAAGFTDELSLDFGSTGAIDAGKGFAVFGDTNADGKLSLAEDNALKVTLDVADLTQMGNVSALDANVLSNAGIDAVRLDLVGEGNFDLASLETQLLAVRHDGLESIVGIDLSQAASLINGSLHFATADTVTLDASAGGYGTHLGTSLKDLQRLGVDAVSFDADVKSIQVDQMGTATGQLSAADIPEFSSALDVTLNLDGSFTGIGAMSKSLAEAGIDHLGVFSSDVSSTDTLSALFGKLESGLDITLKVDEAQTWTVGENFALHGIDLLAGFHLDSKATWGDLIQTLHDSGLGHVQLQESANVTIDDELSAALYESGMLQALPDAAITIHANTALLNTSLKAMADLGVDSVSGQGKLYVELGIKPQDLHTLADLGDLFSAFGLDQGADHSLFGKDQEAGLVIDQTTFSSLGAVGVQELVGELSKLGFTELDVVGDSKVEHVFDITAQTPVLSEVQILGTTVQTDLAHVFDPDILKNNK